jgi:hypothetical protein
MSVSIDTANGTCSTTVGGTTYRSAITDVRVSTDPAARMSMAHIEGHSTHVTEDMAEHLVAAGAKDERENLIADD